MYEAFKMMSFGAADALSMLIPFGVGAAGRAINAASKAGSVAAGIGRGIDLAGKALSFESRFGQVAQGTAGALGIAYAYNRGAFQETLAQNQANAEEALVEKAQKDIYNRYNSDADYKNSIDSEVAKKAAVLKQNYMKQVQQDGGMKIADEKAVDKLCHAQAQKQYLEELTQAHTNDLKQTDDWAIMQQEAITSAGDAATTTFLPTAVKYGIVNNLGFRKFLYTNPTGVAKRVSNTLKGIKEITTEGGKKRLMAEASPFMTSAQKWKGLGRKAWELTKVAGKQAGGGAWTNGTDDMMTDAAERINEDSYNRYINGFLQGESLADIYGFTDGLYSYFKGFSNSIGQETTWNATVVGVLGSVVSSNVNFTNLAHLATKEGRDAYRKNFMQRYKRNDDGTLAKGEDGQPITEKVGWKDNWRERGAYFIQNGVLNTYYGKKQAARDLQSHADYVNNILDDYNDFEDLENLVMSDNAIATATSEGDKKTARFIKALHAVSALNNLANNSKDPATLSSVVEKAKGLIENTAAMQFDPEKESLPEGEEIQSMLSQYYAANPNIEQNANTAGQGLATIIKNAQKLQEATDAYNTAEKEISKAERNAGKTFSFGVRERLKENHALDAHWRERLKSMQDEIGDISTSGELSAEDVIPVYGGLNNVRKLQRVYEKQEQELTKEKEAQQEVVNQAKEKLDKAIEEFSNNADDTKKFELQEAVKKATASYENEKLQLAYKEDLITSTKQKAEKVAEALAAHKESGQKTKVLTADEIMALNPVDRAKMMRNEVIGADKKTGEAVTTRDLYTVRQRREIERLEKRLTMKDADALSKVQDIALLTQRIESNMDSYNKILQNPEAAAVMLDAQKSASAEAAYHLINRRNAQTTADAVTTLDKALSVHKEISQEQKSDVIYKNIRALSTELLGIIDEENMLPKYAKQVKDAIAWAKVIEDIDAAISNAGKGAEWEMKMSRNIRTIVNSSENREDIIANIEKAIDDINDPNVEADLNTLLDGLKTMGYQRDATVLEKRKERKEREAAEKKKREEEQKQKEEAAKQAAEDAAIAQAEAEEAERQAKEAEEAEMADILDAEAQARAAEEAAAAEALDNARADNDIAGDGSNVVSADLVNQANDHTPFVDENSKQTGSEDVSAWASTLMEKDAEPGTISAGRTWDVENGKATEAEFTVTLAKEGNTENKRITFSIGGKAVSLEYTTPEDRVYNPEELQGLDGEVPDEREALSVDSLCYTKGKWYFEGKFRGHDKTYRVEVSDKFNLDEAIEEEKTEREVKALDAGINTDTTHVVDMGDGTIGIRSESLDDQVANLKEQGKNVQVSDDTVDIAATNAIEESKNENGVTTLSGNAMSEYNPQKLAQENVLEHKKGDAPNDSMNKFYNWMKDAGIHLQRIVDTELAKILQNNPHAKVKFMVTTWQKNATHDSDVTNHLFLVLDYDNNINKGIESIHNNDNGGVVESEGKKYLIIGVAGWGSKNNAERRDLYDILYYGRSTNTKPLGLVHEGRVQWFKDHPNERFRVSPNLETEIVPNSLIPGYIVRQLETDEGTEFRNVSDLLKDKERNPHGLKESDLSWGIQQQKRFATAGNVSAEIMVPRDRESNMGRAFVLVPAANGKLVASYLKPLFYNEMNDGTLKSQVMQLLNEVLSGDFQRRRTAAIKLGSIFYLDKDGDFLLLGKEDRHDISLVHDGKVFRTFTLSDDFNRQSFFDAFSEVNPRVNVTLNALGNSESLKQLEEAGALTTDAAMLGIAGSSYSIYGLDGNGKMLEPTAPSSNTAATNTGNTDFRNEFRQQVPYNKRYYTYEKEAYYLNGIPVTDDALIKQLNYNRRLIEGDYQPVTTRGTWNFYLLSGGKNPEMIRVDKNSKKVVELTINEAKVLLEQVANKKAEEVRKANAKEALDNVENVDIDFTAGEIDNTGELRIPSEDDVINNLEATGIDFGFGTEESSSAPKAEENKKAEKKGNTPQQVPSTYTATSKTQSFKELYGNKKIKIKLNAVVKSKWKDAPKKVEELAEYLRKKNIEVDAIGTTQGDIDAWMKTLEDCR